MKFDIITIFPKILDSYINESILVRAQKNKLIKIKTHDLRKWTIGRHKSVDDKPYGGGPGMLFKVEPIFKAVKALTKKTDKKTKVILLSAKGQQFDQSIAKKLAKQDRLIFICGRYEGVDERVAEYVADMELSIGPYVLAGGELPAIIVAEAVARLIPGVLGKAESLAEESFENGKLEYVQYTRPEIFVTDKGKKWRVPKILISGDHKKIREWRSKN